VIRKAALSDILYIDSLRKRYGNAVGFIPKQRYEMEINGERSGVLMVYEENTDLIGFIYATHNNDGVVHIQQVAIQDDARRQERGSELVEAITRQNDWLISLRCADDLEANMLWGALGFDPQNKVTPKSVYGIGKDKVAKSQRVITRWDKIIQGLWKP
jgi:hypothetical protein